MDSAQLMKPKGWFTAADRPGDRTVEQQMRGLDELMSVCPDRTVLDVGCAEGLISRECRRAGAARVHGVDIVVRHIDEAQQLDPDDSYMTFAVADASMLTPPPQCFDIVLMLAVLHKLTDPTRAAKRIAAAARRLCVVRTPPKNGSTIIDLRSRNVPHDIKQALMDLGFQEPRVTLGPFDEWTGYFYR